MSAQDELVQRAKEYAERRGRTLGRELGYGVHGIVFLTKKQRRKKVSAPQSAIKVHLQEPDFRRERDVYIRLRSKRITSIRGCNVPNLLNYDDELRVVEMSVVGRPFLLDFAGAFLDAPPDFSEEVMEDWRAEKQEHFGARWREVQAILRVLEGLGIYYIDVSPKNISLPE